MRRGLWRNSKNGQDLVKHPADSLASRRQWTDRPPLVRFLPPRLLLGLPQPPRLLVLLAGRPVAPQLGCRCPRRGRRRTGAEVVRYVASGVRDDVDGVGSALAGLDEWRRKRRRGCAAASLAGGMSRCVVDGAVCGREVRLWAEAIVLRTCRRQNVPVRHGGRAEGLCAARSSKPTRRQNKNHGDGSIGGVAMSSARAWGGRRR